MPRFNPFAWGRTKLTKLWECAIDGHVVALAWSDALGLIAAAAADGPITLFDAQTGQLRFNLPGHGFGTASVAWSADGQHFASAGQDGKVRLWDPTTGQQTKEMPGGAAWVERVTWCPTLPILASAAGKKLRLWNLNGDMIRDYEDHPSTITDIQWKPPVPLAQPGRGVGGEGDALLASTGYGKLFLWSPEQQKAVREFAWQGSMLALAWSPNGEYIAAGARLFRAFLADEERRGFANVRVSAKVCELAWDPTSRYLATGGADISCVWDCSGEGPAGTAPIEPGGPSGSHYLPGLPTGGRPAGIGRRRRPGRSLAAGQAARLLRPGQAPGSHHATRLER